MCNSGICSFELGGDRAGECSAPSGFRERYGVSPCIVGGCYGDPSDEKWAEEHADEIEKAREAYLDDRREERIERSEFENEIASALRRNRKSRFIFAFRDRNIDDD